MSTFKLSGKELKIISGALHIFLEIPLDGNYLASFSKEKKANLDRLEKRIVEDFLEATEKELDILPREKILKKRLESQFEYNLNDKELQEIKESLEYYIKQSESRIQKFGEDRRNALNTYYNGDEYNLDLEDFVQLNKKLSSYPD